MWERSFHKLHNMWERSLFDIMPGSVFDRVVLSALTCSSSLNAVGICTPIIFAVADVNAQSG